MIGPWNIHLWQTVIDVVDEPLKSFLGEQYHPPIAARSEFVNMAGLIIGQRVKFSTASSIRRKLCLEFGEDYTPYDLVQKRDRFERIVGRKRAATILGMAEGEMKGIGPWTRKSAKLMSALHHEMEDVDFMLFEDKRVRGHLKKLYPDLSILQIEKDLERYSPYRGCITYVLWRRGLWPRRIPSAQKK